MVTEWDHEKCLKLIEEFKKYENLWNPRHKAYYHNITKEDAWKQIGKAFNKDSEEIKRKMDSLRGSFRREKQRIRKGYPSSWFAFKSMSFLQNPRSFASSSHSSSTVTVKSEKLEGDNDISGFEHHFMEIPEEDDFHEEQVEEEEVEDDEIELNTSPPQRRRKRYQYQPQRPAKKMKSFVEDPRINEVYNIIKNIREQKDENSVYAEHVAIKLRKFNEHLRAEVQHQINNILYQAEMGILNYSVPQESVSTNDIY